jgi:hypothetical protein
MKFKGLFGAVVALGAMAAMSVCTQAAVTYSAGVVSKATTDESADFTLPVTATSDTSTDQISGYIVELTYDSSVATPVVTGTDATGADTYVTSDIDDGIIVSGIKETADDGKQTLVVAWASSTPVTLEAATAKTLADVSFKLSENVAANASTAVDVTVVAAASSDEALTTDSSNGSSDGKITVSSGTVFLRGDANGDGVVDVLDVLRVSNYLVDLATIDEANMEKADANNDGTIDVLDVLRISNYLVGLAEID